jgi:hypothetical protein
VDCCDAILVTCIAKGEDDCCVPAMVVSFASVAVIGCEAELIVDCVATTKVDCCVNAVLCGCDVVEVIGCAAEVKVGNDDELVCCVTPRVVN